MYILYYLPLCDYIIPLCDYIIPLCDYIIPLCDYIILYRHIGDEWLITEKDTEAYIPDVTEVLRLCMLHTVRHMF